MSRPSNTRADSSLTAALLRVLRGHRGQRQAIRRGELVQIMRAELPQLRDVSPKTADRRVRDAIAEAAARGGEAALVCNLGNGLGYFIAQEESEVEAYNRQEDSRILSLLRRRRAQKRAARAELAFRRQLEFWR